MKKTIIFLFLGLIAISGMAQKLPDWITKKPRPTNSTYLYVVESATGQTEMQARNRAIGEVFRSTAMRIGQPFDSEEINRALQRGTEYYVISSQYNIPINKVCEYTDNRTSPCRVYVLCQVAKAGNIRVEFDDFNACYEGVNKRVAGEALIADGFDVKINGRFMGESYIESLFANSNALAPYNRGMSIYHSTIWHEKDRWGHPTSKGIAYFLLASGGTMWVLGYAFSRAMEKDGEYKDSKDMRKAGRIGAVTTAIGGAVLLLRTGVLIYGKSQIRKAVNLYNNGRMYSQGDIDMEYGLGGNGVYLTFSF